MSPVQTPIFLQSSFKIKQRITANFYIFFLLFFCLLLFPPKQHDALITDLRRFLSISSRKISLDRFHFDGEILWYIIGSRRLSCDGVNAMFSQWFDNRRKFPKNSPAKSLKAFLSVTSVNKWRKKFQCRSVDIREVALHFRLTSCWRFTFSFSKRWLFVPKTKALNRFSMVISEGRERID